MKRSVLTVLFNFLISFSCFSQLLMTPDEVIEMYGNEFVGVQHDDGTLSMLYQQQVKTKASGTFIQKKVMFFKKASDNVFHCYMFQLFEPSTEIPINVFLYDRDVTKIGEMKWRDESNGVVYKIDEKNQASIITAWIEKEQKEDPKIFHF